MLFVAAVVIFCFSLFMCVALFLLSIKVCKMIYDNDTSYFRLIVWIRHDDILAWSHQEKILWLKIWIISLVHLWKFIVLIAKRTFFSCSWKERKMVLLAQRILKAFLLIFFFIFLFSCFWGEGDYLRTSLAKKFFFSNFIYCIVNNAGTVYLYLWLY